MPLLEVLMHIYFSSITCFDTVMVFDLTLWEVVMASHNAMFLNSKYFNLIYLIFDVTMYILAIDAIYLIIILVYSLVNVVKDEALIPLLSWLKWDEAIRTLSVMSKVIWI